MQTPILTKRAAADFPLVEQSDEQFRFDIRFALSQAGGQLFLDTRSRDRDKRSRALDVLTEKVARRFEGAIVLRRDRSKDPTPTTPRSGM